jgi:hypothetical protein
MLDHIGSIMCMLASDQWLSELIVGGLFAGLLEPFRKEVESVESDVIPWVAPESGRGASCGSRNIERRRIVVACGTRVI